MKPSIHILSIPTIIKGLSTGVLIMCFLVVFSDCRNVSFRPQETEEEPVGDDHYLIPDAVFRAYLRDNICPNAFSSNSKYIDVTHEEVAEFDGTMLIDNTNASDDENIKSLKGIELFKKMTQLTVRETSIDTLMLSEDMMLDSLRVRGNIDLRVVDISGCQKLRYVDFMSNFAIAKLDFSNFPSLNYILLWNMPKLKDLRLNNSPEIEHVMTSLVSGLKTIDVSSLSKLKRLCLLDAKSMQALDVTHNLELSALAITYASGVRSLDVSKNTKLRYLSIDRLGGLTSIDVSNNPELMGLNIIETKLKKLDLSNNPKIRDLNFQGCPKMEEINLCGITSFQYYTVDRSKHRGYSDSDYWLHFKEGITSPEKTDVYTVCVCPKRKDEGAERDISGGLWVPWELEYGYLNLRTVKVSGQVKDNYGWVKVRRLIPKSKSPQAVIQVYDKDCNLVCDDYSPEEKSCKQ